MLVIKQLKVANDFHGMEYKSQWLPSTVTNILQNIFFCVQQKKETQQLWNNLRVSKSSQNLHFWVN